MVPSSDTFMKAIFEAFGHYRGDFLPNLSYESFQDVRPIYTNIFFQNFPQEKVANVQIGRARGPPQIDAGEIYRSFVIEIRVVWSIAPFC